MLPSLQLTVVPEHDPPEQVSFIVHAFLSLQELLLLTWRQPRLMSQESSVQGLLSLQLGAAPPTQAPPEQVSLVVQALPSSHGLELGVKTHRPPWQASDVHGFPSLHWEFCVHSVQLEIGVPPQTPAEQTSL